MKRIRELDGLRGLAALSVFFSHAIAMLPTQNYSVLHALWDGQAAVVLFFVLSGYFLALPYVTTNQPIDVMPFWIRRVFRIYPLYLVSLLLALLLKSLLFHPTGLVDVYPWLATFWRSPVTGRELFKHILFVGPGLNTDAINPVIWSLVIEMRMSLVFPLILYALRWAQTKKRVVLLLLAGHVFALVGCLLGHAGAVYALLFMLGGLLAQFGAKVVEGLQSLPRWLYALLAGLALVLYATRYSIRVGLPDGLSNYLIGVGSCLAILFSLASKQWGGILRGSVVAFLGDISYGLYLLHLPVLLSCTSYLLPLTHSYVLVWAVSLTLTLALAYASWRWCERPLHQVGRSLAKRAAASIHA